MTRRFFVVVLALLSTSSLAQARPQSIAPQANAPQSQPPPVPARPGAPRTLVLPQVLIAGARATLAALDAQGRLIPGVDVELSSGGKITTDETGRAGFLAPTQPGVLTARITESGQNFSVAVLSAPGLAAGKGPAADPSAAPDLALPPRVIVPSFIALGSHFDILGAGFSGDAYRDSVSLGNLPALILAASPVSLVVQPNPRTSPGLAELTAGFVGSRPPSATVQVVSLEVVGPAVPVAPNQNSAFTVRVAGSTQRLAVEVRSLTPDVVDLARGNDEFRFTSGGPANVALVRMRGGKAGNYVLSARLAIIGPLNFEAAREELLATGQVAPPAWQKRITGLVREAQHARDHGRGADTRSAARLRVQIQVLLRAHAEDAMAGVLRLALQSLGSGATS